MIQCCHLIYISYVRVDLYYLSQAGSIISTKPFETGKEFNMLLVKPGVGATVIAFPNIEDAVQKVLLRWYSDSKAKQYSADVQEFFKTNAKFPENDVYKFENRALYRLNVQNGTWEKTKNTKASYVIDDKNVKFWEAFDKSFPYLLDYKAEIQQIIQNKTSTMFEVAMLKTNFANRNTDGLFELDLKEGSLIQEAIIDYVKPQEQEAYITKILTAVFHMETMPIFLMDNGVTVAAISKNTISTDVDDKALKDLLEKSFSTDDAQLLQNKLINAIRYNIDLAEEVLVNERGEIVVNIGGLHVIPFGSDNKKCLISNDSNNIKLFLELLQKEGYEISNTGGVLEFKNGYAPADSRKQRTYTSRLGGFTNYSKNVLPMKYPGKNYTVEFEFIVRSHNNIHIGDVIVAYYDHTDFRIADSLSEATVTISKNET